VDKVKHAQELVDITAHRLMDFVVTLLQRLYQLARHVFTPLLVNHNLLVVVPM
jgi:hypothetical protein